MLTDLCQTLAETFEVHVVCGQPVSPSGDPFVRVGVEERSGVMVHRLEHRQFAKRIPAGRLINLVSFSRAASKYLRCNQISPEVIISETDPFLLPIVASKHAKRSGSKLVCYLQDIYPDVAEAIGKVKAGALTRHIRTRLRGAYDSADRIVVLGDCMRARLQAPPWSLELDRMTVIPNWADCKQIRPLDVSKNHFRSQHGLRDRFVVMHSGNMGLTQRLDVLLEATSQDAWPQNAVLVLVGDGAERARLQTLAQQVPEGRVRFFPYQPREKLAESLSAADLHVVSMHENIAGCLCPSKLYGILAAGRPVLAISSPSTDLHETVVQEKLGWCCEPGDASLIARSVRAAVGDKQATKLAGQRSRLLAEGRFDRDVVIQSFREMIGSLTCHSAVA